MTQAELDTATLAVAMAALLVGLRSAWRDYQRDKLLLRVIPKIAYPVGPMPDRRPCLAFEIVNDSAFPVTVDEVGFLYYGTAMRGAMGMPLTPNGETWPHRLEPMSSITVYSKPEYLLESAHARIHTAYVSTSTGRTFRGSSKILKHLVKTGEVPEFSGRLSHTGSPGYITVAEPRSR
jgi:hypothetical protein